MAFGGNMGPVGALARRARDKFRERERASQSNPLIRDFNNDYSALVAQARKGDRVPLVNRMAEISTAALRNPRILRSYEGVILRLMNEVAAAEWDRASAQLNRVLQKQLDWYYRYVFPQRAEDSAVRSFLQELAKLEDLSALYRRKIRALFLKRRIPKTYAKAATQPVQNKAVYVQPRTGLNQSFQYMYEYLETHGGWRQELWELYRSEIPVSFYYRNAEAMAQSAGTAKAVFLHESSNLLGLVDFRPETKVVQLWHGCGVFKKIGLDTAGQPGGKSLKSYETYPEYSYYSCVTIASPELAWVFEQFMGIPKEAGIIRPLGVSRTDYFFEEAYRAECYRKLHEIIPQAKDKKVILYAPTYRGRGQQRVAPDALDVAAMQRALGDDFILIVKHHQTAKDLPEIPRKARDSFAFDMTRGKGMDIGELMTVADICISDYSSLVFEFSLFERPMAFFVYDLEEYIDNRGLYYDFGQITPGPLCRTTQDLIDYVLEVKDNFDKSEVVAFKNKFMSGCDGHSTERIVAYIEGGDGA